MKLTKSAAFVAALALIALLTLARPGVAAEGERVGSVSGSVRGPDGRPVAGVSVRLVPDGQIKARGGEPAADDKADEEKSAKKKKKPGFTATTDTNGKFRFENVPAASYRISATLSEVGSVRKNLTVTAGHDFPIHMQLKRKV